MNQIRLIATLYILVNAMQLSAQQMPLPPEPEALYKVVDNMPIIKTCSNFEDNYLTLRLCSDSQIYTNIYGNESFFNLKVDSSYNHVFNFIIEKDGSLSNYNHIKSRGKNVEKVINIALDSMSANKVFRAGVNRYDTVRV